MVKDTRKLVEIGRKRIPLRKLLHGKEIREAAKALEDFRISLNEQELLYGAKLTIKMDTYGEAVLYAHRLETDNEYEARIDKARLAALKKAELEKERKLKELARAAELENKKRQEAIDSIIKIAKTTGLTNHEVDLLLNSLQT